MKTYRKTHIFCFFYMFGQLPPPTHPPTPHGGGGTTKGPRRATWRGVRMLFYIFGCARIYACHLAVGGLGQVASCLLIFEKPSDSLGAFATAEVPAPDAFVAFTK